MNYKIPIVLFGISLLLFLSINMSIALEVYDQPVPASANSTGASNASSENLTRSVWRQINESNITTNSSNETFGARDYAIRLPKEILEPENNTGNITTLSEIVPSDKEYYLIQVYNNSLPQEEYDEMKQDNITFLNYISNDTYIVKIPQNVVENKIYPSLRWVGYLNYSQKIDTSLENLTSSTNSTNITIAFFENFTTQAQKDLIVNLSNYVIFNSSSSEFMTINMNGTRINETTNLSFVYFMYGYSGSIEYFLDRSAQVIAADYVWPSNDASGITVGIMDSGIDFGHPHFVNAGIIIYNATDYVDGEEPAAVCGDLGPAPQFISALKRTGFLRRRA